MSTLIKELENIQGSRGTANSLTITQFYMGEGLGTGLQITQEDMYIQLSLRDTYRLIVTISEWIKDESCKRKEKLEKQIVETTELKNTILQDAVECSHFIEDLKVLKIPVHLLGNLI